MGCSGEGDQWEGEGGVAGRWGGGGGVQGGSRSERGGGGQGLGLGPANGWAALSKRFGGYPNSAPTGGAALLG